MRIQGTILGSNALARQFERLSETAKSKVIRQATNYAMTPVLQEARARTPVSDAPHRTSYNIQGQKVSKGSSSKGRIVAPGFLKRSLKKKTSQSKSRHTTRTKVGAAGREAYYGLFIERGFKSYAPNPFLQEALGARSMEATTRFSRKMRQAIAREVRKTK